MKSDYPDMNYIIQKRNIKQFEKGVQQQGLDNNGLMNKRRNIKPKLQGYRNDTLNKMISNLKSNCEKKQ